MSNITGYSRSKEIILTYIAENQPKELSRAKVASLLGCSMSSAGNYLSILANEFPKNLQYMRGVLYISSIIPDESLPPSVRMGLKQERINKVKGMLKTLAENHLKHYDKEKIEEGIKRIRKEMNSL